jgi:uncharacterized protein
MFQDLEIIDFHCHFPVAGDPSMAVAGGSSRIYELGTPADAKAQYLRDQADKYRVAWRHAWDFPEPEKEPRSPEEQADRWLAELEKYGISRVGFATGGDNETLSSVVARYPDRRALPGPVHRVCAPQPVQAGRRRGA